MVSQEQQPVGRAARSAGWPYVAVVAIAGASLFWHLGVPALDEHEAKLAVPAHNMRTQNGWLVPGVDSRGHPYTLPAPTPLRYWLVPIENGRPRLLKTPLAYWTAAGLAWLTGRPVDELTSRLTSAVSAMLVVGVTLLLGRRLVGIRAALIGSFMLAVSIGLVKYGRNARPEMLMTLFVTGAMAAFFLGLEAPTRRGRIGWMLAFWVLLGLGNLAKQFVPLLVAWPLLVYLGWRQSVVTADEEGATRLLGKFLGWSLVGLIVHTGLVYLASWTRWDPWGALRGRGLYVSMGLCLGLPLLWYLNRSRAWSPIRSLWPTAVPGALLMGLIFVPWMVYMAYLFGDFATGVFAHEIDTQAIDVRPWRVTPPWFYLGSLAILTWPWTGFLPAGLGAVVASRLRERRAGLVYLFLWSVGFVLLFAAAPGKRHHYLLPMLPAICLLMGVAAEDLCWRQQWLKPVWGRWLGVAYAGAGVASFAVLWAIGTSTSRWNHLGPVLAVAAVPLVAAAWMAWSGRLKPLVPLIGLSMLVTYMGHYRATEQWDRRVAFRDFSREAARLIPPHEPVYCWENPECKMVFYFGRAIPDVRWRFLREDPGAKPAVIEERMLAWLKSHPTEAPWIVGHEPAPDPQVVRPDQIHVARKLAPLGYRAVLTMDTGEKDRPTIVLYHFSPADRAGTSAVPPAGVRHHSTTSSR